MGWGETTERVSDAGIGFSVEVVAGGFAASRVASVVGVVAGFGGTTAAVSMVSGRSFTKAMLARPAATATARPQAARVG